MSIEFHWMHRKGWSNTEFGLTLMAKQLEEANVTSVLLPYGPIGVDFSIFLPPILKATEKIRMMLALPAYGLTPEYAAKTFEGVDKYGRGRLDLNLVAGKYDDEKQNFIINAYPGDVSLVDTHESRVALTEPWMEKFVYLMQQSKFEAKLCVVGSSDTTLRIANKYTDYIIVGEYMLTDHFLSQITNKPILIIDPLVLKEGQEPSDVKYYDYEYTLEPNHTIKGTHSQVVQQIKDISKKFNVNDFMILTDQRDLSGIFGVIKELTESDNN